MGDPACKASNYCWGKFILGGVNLYLAEVALDFLSFSCHVPNRMACLVFLAAGAEALQSNARVTRLATLPNLRGSGRGKDSKLLIYSHHTNNFISGKW
jgi:hypothetical protein